MVCSIIQSDIWLKKQANKKKTNYESFNNISNSCSDATHKIYMCSEENKQQTNKQKQNCIT